MGIFTKKEENKEELSKVKKKTDTFKTIDPIGWRVLDKPYISEKATELEKENRYIFKVMDSSNKIQIKKAIEEIYGVNVLSVNTIKIPRKKKRLGKHKGWRKGFKKAVVQIKKGERIDAVSK